MNGEPASPAPAATRSVAGAEPGSPRKLTLVLMAATGVGFLPWFAISALGPFLVADLGTSPALPGRLVGLLFLVGAAVSLRIGYLIVRFGAGRLLRLTFLLCGSALVLMSLAPTVATMAVAVALAGLVLAVPMPATTALVTAQVPSDRRGGVIGVAQSGQQVGALIAGATLPLLASLVGWRWSLGAAAAVSLVIGVVVATGFGAPAPVRRVMPTRRTPRWLLAYALLMSSGTVSAVAHLPVFGSEVHQMSATVAGALVTVIGAVAIGGKIGWGRIAGQAARPTAPPVALSVVGSVSLLLAALSGLLGTWAVWASAALLGAGALAWPVVTLSLVARLFPPESAGAVSGRTLAAGFSGAAMGPVLFGWVLETWSFTHAWWLTVSAVTLALAIVSFADRLARRSVRAGQGDPSAARGGGAGAQ